MIMSTGDALAPVATAVMGGDRDSWTITSTVLSPEATVAPSATDTLDAPAAPGAPVEGATALVAATAATAVATATDRGWSSSATVRLSSRVCVEPTAPPPVASVATAAAAGAAAATGASATIKGSKGLFFRRATKDTSSPSRSRRLSKAPSADKVPTDAVAAGEAAAAVAPAPAAALPPLSAGTSVGGSVTGSEDAAGPADEAVPPPAAAKPSRKSLSEAVAPHAKADAAAILDSVDNIGALLDTAVTASATAGRQLPALDPAGVHAAYMAIAKYLTTASTVQRGFPVTALLLAAAERALRAVDALQSLRLLAYRGRAERAATGRGSEPTVPAVDASGDEAVATLAGPRPKDADAVEEDADLRALTADYATAVRDALERVVCLFPSKEDSFLGRWQKRGAVFISPATKAAMVVAARELDASRLAVRAPLAAVCGAYDAPGVDADGRMLSPTAEQRFS